MPTENNTNLKTQVNKKNPILFLNEQSIPHIVHTDGSVIKLPDNPFGRWYARVHYPTMSATPDGVEWYKQHDPMRLDPIPGLISTLKPFQSLGVNRMKISNCALWFDMGLGKSITSLAYCLDRYARAKGSLFLVVCPPTVFVSWQDEVEKHIDKKLIPQIIIAHGPKKQALLAKLKAKTPKNPTFIITSYETLESIRESLSVLPISVIVFDESSKIKTPATQRTRSAFALTQALPYVRCFVLSGTPSTNNCLGLYSQYEILGSGFSGCTNFTVFKSTYADEKKFMTFRIPTGKIIHIPVDEKDNWLHTHYPNIDDPFTTYSKLGYSFSEKPKFNHELRIINYYPRVTGFKNLDKIQKITHLNAYCLKKEDVLPELPEKAYIRRHIEMSAEQKKAYNELLESSRFELGKTILSFKNSSGVHAKLHQIANGYVQNQGGENYFFKKQPKLNELEQILEELGDSKLVIWSPFPIQIEQIVEFLKSIKRNCAFIHGGVPVNRRPDIIHDFQNSAGTQNLVLNPDVAALGLNLTCAHTEVFMSNWFKPDVRAQAEDRLHRIGQKSAVTVIDIIAQNTLETKLLNTLIQKIDLENQLLSLEDLKG